MYPVASAVIVNIIGSPILAVPESGENAAEEITGVAARTKHTAVTDIINNSIENNKTDLALLFIFTLLKILI
ncbi:hypothetical protein COS75_00720 [Candidatus Pacearchaeota archaeon CG06_land_8_20_14_3_00_35_12]|nr:MAG: hypothetical protein COS75_00720 [Candidatus Pacearchaeota archaeon CG06_land_8_20_14_3_00_35_12]